MGLIIGAIVTAGAMRVRRERSGAPGKQGEAAGAT
jgi:hypothetical protein